ncbi:MAG: DUF6880 family protein [Bryobacteraceae bacterium]
MDPVERQIELAFQPGVYIHDRMCFSFVSGLEAIAADIAKLVIAEPARAVALYDTLLAGCHEKAGELDDSSGSFGQYVGGLICGWILARQAAGADADKTAGRLVAWMDDDSYAFCYRIEADVARAFDQTGLAAFEKQVRSRFEAASSGQTADYPRRQWSGVLRAIYLEQKNPAAYVALAEQTKLTAQDCHAVATLLAADDKPEDALDWVERGLVLAGTLPGAGYDLTRLQRELWVRLGRGEEALAAAWADFQDRPSKYAYEELAKYVRESERPAWHAKAMDVAKGADLGCLIELFVETDELERLTELVSGTTDETLEQLSHYYSEPAAEQLQEIQPGLAARLWRAQGMRIVNAGKSRHYDAAISDFERAKSCYERAGLGAEWEETVRQVRARHSRKTGFRPGFEALVAGSRRTRQASFLERAKTRWAGRQGRDDS